MNLEAIGLILALVLQTVVLVRWGTRLQITVERHDESLNGPRGLHAWRHDVVTPRLIALDEIVDDRKEGREWSQS